VSVGASDKKQNANITEDYVPVSNDKKLVAVPRPLKLREMAQMASRGKGKKGAGSMKGLMKPQVVWLVQDIDVQSAANTAFVGNFGLTPGSATEFSAFAGLYDEYKCSEAKFVFKNILQASPTNGTTLAVLAYNPISATSLTSVAKGCEQAEHMLWGCSFNTTTATVIPQNVDSSGLWTFSPKVPKGAAINALTELGQVWTSVTDATVNYGYVLAYLEALGGTGVSRLRGILYMKTWFRARM